MAELLRNIPAEYSWTAWSMERQRANAVRDDFYKNYYSVEGIQKVRVYFVNNKVDYVF